MSSRTNSGSLLPCTHPLLLSAMFLCVIREHSKISFFFYYFWGAETADKYSLCHNLYDTAVLGETFGIDVNFDDGDVYIETPVAYYTSIPLASVRTECYTLMGSLMQENTRNICIGRMQGVISEHLEDELAESGLYVQHYLVSDVPYDMLERFYFIDVNGVTVGTYEIYESLDAVDDYVLYDVMYSKWYEFSAEAFAELTDQKAMGGWSVLR